MGVIDKTHLYMGNGSRGARCRFDPVDFRGLGVVVEWCVKLYVLLRVWAPVAAGQTGAPWRFGWAARLMAVCLMRLTFLRPSSAVDWSVRADREDGVGSQAIMLRERIFVHSCM